MIPGNALENPVAKGRVEHQKEQTVRERAGHEPSVAKVAKAPLTQRFSMEG